MREFPQCLRLEASQHGIFETSSSDHFFLPLLVYGQSCEQHERNGMILETAVEAHVQLQSMKPKGFSTAPQFTKVVNSSMASNG